jgi:hypothetical protein
MKDRVHLNYHLMSLGMENRYNYETEEKSYAEPPEIETK